MTKFKTALSIVAMMCGLEGAQATEWNPNEYSGYEWSIFNDPSLDVLDVYYCASESSGKKPLIV